MNQKIIFHIGACIKAIILLGFITLFAYFILTKELTLYIHPRFTYLTELTICLLIPLFVMQTIKIFQRPITASSICCRPHSHDQGSKWEYTPFIATLLLAFLVPTTSLDANFVANKGLNSKISSSSLPNIDLLPRPMAADLARLSTIQVTEKNYTEVMSEINLYPKDYIGKEITMIGFVFKNPDLLPHQFSLVRYVVTCCSADALPYGVLCEAKDAAQYQEGKWLQIRGLIQQSTYNGEPVGMVKTTAATEIAPPKDPYVFPLAQ
jgi:putative membrane protein